MGKYSVIQDVACCTFSKHCSQNIWRIGKEGNDGDILIHLIITQTIFVVLALSSSACRTLANPV